MSSASTVLRILVAATFLAVAACALSTAADETGSSPRPPREIRSGAAEMIMTRVERNVSREEVASAVQALVTTAPICLPWPGLWIQDLERRNIFLVRYDLMARDWGEASAANGRRRMQEFVDMGLLTQVERIDIGPNIIEYTLTQAGDELLRGSPYSTSGVRPSFCLIAPRRVVDITDMQWGQFECGTLLVRFTHVADDWPAWAQSEDLRARISSSWPPNGMVAEGTVSLGRQWFSRQAMPPGLERNGALRSVCFDSERGRVIGNDLNLSPSG
jgi:hypothetical protein